MTESARRSMSQALRTAELPAEALELIRAGNPKPVSDRTIMAASPVETGASISEKKPAEVAPPERPTDPKETATNEAIKTNRSRTKEDESGLGGIIVTASFRLPAEIPNALLRASVDRKIKKLKPWTQQEIAAEALNQWLKRNGYGN